MTSLQTLKDNLTNDQGIEEKVEVNQRHLIDKILARYSASHTIFRELLQNSNDANAQSVQIIFTTQKEESSLFSFPWNQKPNVVSITYKNNGLPFSDTDFARLRKIAEGNPDETKIGFFGVGFYSLFSICEEPFITSGESTMGFFWKRDMLYTKRGVLPLESRTEWTTFYLTCREPIELPDIQDFAKFIATSLAFTTNIQKVQVFFDDERVLHFHRRGQAPRELEIPKNVYQLASPHKLFTLQTIKISQIQLDVEICSKLNINVTLFMKIATGTAIVTLPKRMIEEMHRTTKKLPPKSTPVRIMLSNFEEHDSTLQTIRGSESIFEELIPHPDKQGHVFIGFPTHQTTGCSIQAAGHFIPTVERESIDFVDKTLQAWNLEYVSMFGLLARICFDNEVSKISELLGNMILDKESAQWFYNKIGHNLSMFHFKTSTPSPIVGRILGDQFFKCNSKPLEMISSKGRLVPIASLRLPAPPEMDSFIQLIQTLPQDFINTCPGVVEDYKRRGILTEITVRDVLEEVSNRALPQDQLIAFMKWWIRSIYAKKVTKSDLDVLKRNLLYLKDQEPFPMSQITSFATQRLVPNDLPIPHTCLFHELVKHFEPKDLIGCFWNWKELQLMEWVQFIVTNQSFGTDAKFTERVMQTISRHFNNCSQTDKALIASHLSQRPCVVTTSGLQIPSNTYFPSVSLFSDLLIVNFEYPKSVSEQFLKFLGVREHVDLQLVFDRIGDLSWDQVQLIKYLSSIQEKLTSREWSTLEQSSLFLKEGTDNQSRYPAKELYTPTEKFRKLGFPVLEWNGKWKFTSDEAKFLKRLGLQSQVKLELLLQMISKGTLTERQQLLHYMMEQFDVDYAQSYTPEKIKIPFLPIQNSDRLGLPLDCYTNPEVAVMGFLVVDPLFKKYAMKLGVSEAPSGDRIMERLFKVPIPITKASEIFTFLASQQSSLNSRNWATLRTMEFIPVQMQSKIVYFPPSRVYLKTEHSEFQNTFVYVSFGSVADTFLRACGVQEQPSPVELAASIVKDPNVYLSKGYDEYLNILRQIAANFRTIKSNRGLLSQMKRAEFLIGITAQDENGKSTQKYSLAKASDIFLIDDTVLAQLFHPLGAPIEELLESMYVELGSQWLSNLVQISYSPTGNLFISKESEELQRVIQERAPLILYDGHQTRPDGDLLPKALSMLQSLKVQCVSAIGIVRKFNGISKSQETSSCLVTLKGIPTLLVTREFDYFDVASMLAKLILKQPRLNDSLLISTLISTSLQNLTRKGFPVDRILNLQSNKKVTPSEFPKPLSNQSSVSSVNTSIAPPETASTGPARTATVSNTTGMEKRPEPRNSIVSNDLFGGVVKSITKSLGLSDKEKSPYNRVPEMPGSWEKPPVSPSRPPEPPITPQPVRKPSITHQDKKIVANQLQNSISNVRSASNNSIKTNFPSSQETQPPVSTYCSPLTDQDLVLVTVINDTPVYVDKSVADQGIALILSNEDAIERFSLVLELLSIVFGLPPKSTQIYWDSDGSTVAFNRNRGTLFFNLRYYLGWHYQNSNGPEKASTYHSWYMTFCHELAHNFHGPHDATHEYWMSSFAENYLGKLITMMDQYGIRNE